MTALGLSLIGAVIILDKYAIGEFGFSQPLVSGLIFGLIFGKIEEGILIGSIFQLIFLGGLPIGRDIPPDGQGGGIVACGSYFLLGRTNTPESALAFGMLTGFFASIAGGGLELLARRLNERLYNYFMNNEKRLLLCHLGGIGTALLRGLVLFLPLFFLAKMAVLPRLTVPVRNIFLLTGVSLGAANGIYLFVKKNTLVYFVMGILCASAFFVF